MLTLEKALAAIHALPLSALATKTVALHQAVGRVLAHDVYATHDLPPFDASAMDGYAVNLQTAQNEWQVIGRSMAGELTSVALQPGQAWRIFTGGVLPVGAQAVIMQEHIAGPDASGFIRSDFSVVTNQHVRRKGSEQQAGTLMLKAGTYIKPQHIGMLAAQGLRELSIYRRPVVGVLSSGNELAQAAELLPVGKIYDANRPQLLALVHACGCTAIDLGVVSDDLVDTVNTLQQAAARCDLLITSGGASVGEADFLRDAIDQAGKMNYWKVAIKPGKPFALGQVYGKSVLALPGNPVAAFVTFYLLAAPLLKRATGALAQENKTMVQWLPLQETLAGGEPRRQFLRGKLIHTIESTSGRHTTQVQLCEQQGSAALQSLAQADVLVEIAEQASVNSGDLLACHFLT